MRRLARRYRWGRTQHEDSGDVAQLRSTIRSLERETRSEPHSVAFRVFDTISVIVFTVEYALRHAEVGAEFAAYLRSLEPRP